MSQKRILLMYISETSGHHSATIAIEKALRILDPRTQILNINSFTYTNPLLEKIINKAYLGVIKKMPHIWDFLYDNPFVVEKTQSLKTAIHKSNFRKLKVLFEEFNPNVVACTQAFPCGIVADYKVKFNLNFSLLGVLTDFLPHGFWFYDHVNYYIVASDEAKQRFIKEGFPERKIRSLGIPIDPKFSLSLEKNKIAKKFDLDLNLPIILVMGGGQGIGPIKHIVLELTKSKFLFQIIVVAGKNKKLLSWLNKQKSRFHKRLITFEYVNNIEELMQIATFIVTKPGGLTAAEALAKGLPLVIVKPIPGQEINNTIYLLKKDVAIEVDEIKHINPQIEAVLNNQGKFQEMRKKALALGKPRSALDIAQFILNLNV
ncbi:MAG: glycosyltransferase [Candidatus Omnitrophota bacterium]|nr:glycosyltransferase [Candidatus Omnitrophota bacterium]